LTSDGDPAVERLRERLRAEGDERRRLAELIHDGPVQHVAAVAQMLDAAAVALDDGDVVSARSVLGRALAVTREASADLREVVAGIEPQALQDEGFASAVRELADRVAGRHGIEIALDVKAGDRLGAGAQSGLYQIVREALDQAVRRGPPSRMTVAVEETTSGGVSVTVHDDGSKERRQAVLDGLAVRASDLNGTFEAERGESGTTIRVALPPTAASL
jgi:two-component system NarL family sensor kinase